MKAIGYIKRIILTFSMNFSINFIFYLICIVLAVFRLLNQTGWMIIALVFGYELLTLSANLIESPIKKQRLKNKRSK